MDTAISSPQQAASDPPPRRSWVRPGPMTHLLILGFAALHLAIAAALPLITFETHYALYGLHLDWSYVDHPPLTGWIQGLVQRLSSSDLALRLAPIAIMTASQYLIAALALRLFPRATPWLGVVVVLLLQGAGILHLGFAMAPEVPLLLAGLFTFWYTLAVIEHNRTRDWLGLGVALGLAGLAKYTAITLAFSVVIAVVTYGSWRQLRQPMALLAVALAGVLVSPVVIWNWQHDWVSFTYQLGYQLSPEEAGTGWSLADAAGNQLEQFGAYSPLLYVGGVAGLCWGLWRRDKGAVLSAMFALPILLLVGYLAGAGRSSPHWTLLGWVMLAPLAGVWILSAWRCLAVRWLTYVSAGLSVVVVLLLILITLPWLPFPDFRHPLSRLVGWPEATARAELLRRQWAQEAGPEPVLLVRNWHYAGPLAWYGQPGVVQETGSRTSQYVYWYGRPGVGARGILVQFEDGTAAPVMSAPGFECTLVDQLPAYRGPTLARMFFYYRCRSTGAAAVTPAGAGGG